MPSYLSNNNQNTTAPSYSDIDPSMLMNTKTNDLLTVQNTKSVRQSIMNLLMTAYGERLFQPNIGGSIRALLFEPIDPLTTFELRDRILNTLRNHEPRIGTLYVDVVSQPDSNSYRIGVEFTIRGTGERDRITTVLERIR